jgi:hypothetical protein
VYHRRARPAIVAGQVARRPRNHRFAEKKVRASQRFERFHAMERTLEDVAAANVMRKRRGERLAGSVAQGRSKFVAPLFQIAAR